MSDRIPIRITLDFDIDQKQASSRIFNPEVDQTVNEALQVYFDYQAMDCHEFLFNSDLDMQHPTFHVEIDPPDDSKEF